MLLLSYSFHVIKSSAHIHQMYSTSSSTGPPLLSGFWSQHHNLVHQNCLCEQRDLHMTFSLCGWWWVHDTMEKWERHRSLVFQLSHCSTGSEVKFTEQYRCLTNITCYCRKSGGSQLDQPPPEDVQRICKVQCVYDVSEVEICTYNLSLFYYLCAYTLLCL